jgi:hypothetical protein
MIRATMVFLWLCVTSTCGLIAMFQAATTPREVDIVPLALCFAAWLLFVLANPRKSR